MPRTKHILKKVRMCFPGEKAAEDSGRIVMQCIYIYIMQLCNTIDDSQHQNIPLDKSPQHNLKLDQCE